MFVSVEEFNDALWQRFHSGKIRNVYPLSKYNDIIEKIKTMSKSPPCNMPGEYYLLRKFVVVNVGGKERLSCKPEFLNISENSKECHAPKTKFYVALEEIHEYLDEAHRCLKHGCRDKIFRKIQSQGIVNITRETAELYLSFCKHCRPKKKEIPKRNVPKHNSWEVLRERPCDQPVDNDASESNIQNSHFHKCMLTDPPDAVMKVRPYESQPVCTFTRGFIDLIDLRSNPDGDYKFIFVYIDIQTCFCVLQPIKCKCTSEVVAQLLNIFSLIGSPEVLHSNLDSQFITETIEELRFSWPDILIVHGAKNYSELQEVAENCLVEIKTMLKHWMLENNSNNWSCGLRFIQLKKNTKLPYNETKSPFECFFGRSIKSCNLLSQISHTALKSIQKEDELLAIINERRSPDVQPYEQLQVSLDPDICNLVQKHDDSCEMPEIETVIKQEVLDDS